MSAGKASGHHAETPVFGGFCYFNSNAIAANYLSKFGKVAILDIDYHHGNGQQEIFYERNDVLTISIHGHPSFAYPYFSGYADEKGSGPGYGYNVNYPLKEKISGEEYRATLARALSKIRKYSPDYLVIALGLDTSKNDPTGTWSLLAKDFEENGKMIASLGLPILVVQEGGYRNRVLGINARHFFNGIKSVTG
ncbi:MAG: histone deacetylase family protein [Bacteroidales bacterium]